MHSTSYVNSNNSLYMNVGDEVPKSSHYVNQQTNCTNKLSSYVNLTESEIGSYTALQHTDLSKKNYEQLKLNSQDGLSCIQMLHYICDLPKPLKITKYFEQKYLFKMTFIN